uniref:Uncharacterized protein n=1 Tax=Moniliophthora roreri TaxID=221103 RepID=A0A0W0FYA8_MONRR
MSLHLPGYAKKQAVRQGATRDRDESADSYDDLFGDEKIYNEGNSDGDEVLDQRFSDILKAKRLSISTLPHPVIGVHPALALPGYASSTKKQAVRQGATRNRDESTDDGDEDLDQRFRDTLKAKRLSISTLPHPVIGVHPALSLPNDHGKVQAPVRFTSSYVTSTFTSTPNETRASKVVAQFSVVETPVTASTTSTKGKGKAAQDDAPTRKRIKSSVVSGSNAVIASTSSLTATIVKGNKPTQVGASAAQNTVSPPGKDQILGKRKTNPGIPTQAMLISAVVQALCYALEKNVTIPALGNWADWDALFLLASWKIYKELTTKSYAMGIVMNIDWKFAHIRRNGLEFNQQIVDDCLRKARETLAKERASLPKPKVAASTSTAPAATSGSQVTLPRAPAPSDDMQVHSLCEPSSIGEKPNPFHYTSLTRSEADVSALQRPIRPLPGRIRSTHSAPQHYTTSSYTSIDGQQGGTHPSYGINQPMFQHAAPLAPPQCYQQQVANATSVASRNVTLPYPNHTLPTPYHSATQAQAPLAGPSASTSSNGLQFTSGSLAYGNPVYHDANVVTPIPDMFVPQQDIIAPAAAPISGLPPGATQNGIKVVTEDVPCLWISNGKRCGHELSPDENPRDHCMRAHPPERIVGGPEDRRYRCGWEGCKKTFNTDGLKKHLNKGGHFGFDLVRCEYCSGTAARDRIYFRALARRTSVGASKVKKVHETLQLSGPSFSKMKIGFTSAERTATELSTLGEAVPGFAPLKAGSAALAKITAKGNNDEVFTFRLRSTRRIMLQQLLNTVDGAKNMLSEAYTAIGSLQSTLDEILDYCSI